MSYITDYPVVLSEPHMRMGAMFLALLYKNR
jgi:hypothetical protein